MLESPVAAAEEHYQYGDYLCVWLLPRPVVVALAQRDVRDKPTEAQHCVKNFAELATIKKISVILSSVSIAIVSVFLFLTLLNKITDFIAISKIINHLNCNSFSLDSR